MRHVGMTHRYLGSQLQTAQLAVTRNTLIKTNQKVRKVADVGTAVVERGINGSVQRGARHGERRRAT